MIFKKTIYIFGASGHAKEIANLAKNTAKGIPTFHNAVFVTPFGEQAGTLSEEDLSDLAYSSYFRNGNKFTVAVGIGSPRIREKIAKKIDEDRVLIPRNLISSSAVVPDEIRYSNNRGLIVCPGVTVTVDVRLGRHAHLNTGCTICHDVQIGDYSIISPNATICGKVEIGDRCYIGAGAVIKDGVSIMDDVTVGAGAVVVKDIDTPGTYVGCPASFLKKGSL